MPHLRRDRATDQDALLSVAQAAALLGVHPNTLRAWTDAGRLTAYRINLRGDRRYRRGEVERLLAEGAPTDEATVPAEPEERSRELVTLARLAQGSGPSATPTTVSRTAVEALRTALGVARAAIYVGRDGPGNVYQLETHAGYRFAPPSTLRDVSDIQRGEDPVARPITDDPSAPMRVQLPLAASGELIGFVILEDDPGGPLADLRPAFLTLAGAVIAGDLQTARVLARARREVARARALRHVTQEMTGELDLGKVLNDIVERTRSLFDADKAGLWLVEEGADPPFHEAAWHGLGEAFRHRVRQLSMDSPAVGVRAVRERRTYVVRDANTRADVGALKPIYVAEGIQTACLVPLVSNDRSVGVIGLYHTRDREWPEDELTLAQSFANQAAVAIANARLYRSVADQAARMRSIQDLSARLNRLTDVQAIADAIVAEASTLAEYHDIRVYVVDRETGTCEPIAFTDRLLGGVDDFRDALRVEIGEGSFTGWVAERGEPILANDALHDPRSSTIAGTEEIEESMLVVPMLFEGRSVGVIALSKLGRNQFSTDDLQTMTIFAGYAAQAIANASAYARLELQSAELGRQLQSQRRMLEINERLLSSLDRQDVLETIADGLRSVVSYDNLSIYRVDDLHRVLTPVLTRERHDEQVRSYDVPFGRGLMGWAVDHAEPMLANDALNDPRAMQIPGTPEDPEAIVVVPLIADEVVIGCLNISRVGGPEAHFSQADFELVKLFAGQASIALRNAEEHQAITARADTDSLTGLGNHGAFQRTLAHLLGQRDGSHDGGAPQLHAEPGPTAVLMMDLDEFKAYNDRLGHPAGDALLHAIGTAIYGAARSEDRVFRYGGDEFAMILAGVDAETARAVGERVRAAVNALTAGEPTPVTICVGAAAAPDDASDKDALIAAADTALYYGKRSGGDRVVLVRDVPRDTRELRTTLDRLARAALNQPADASAVDSLVEVARRSAVRALDGDGVRDALLSVARSLDSRDTATAGHADRVGWLTHRVAEELDLSENARRTVELAARLQGFAALGSGELEAIPSLREVSRILQAQASPHEAGELPVGAQIVEAVNSYDLLLTGSVGERVGRREAMERISIEAGGRVGRTVIEALAAVVGGIGHGTHARRAEDTLDDTRDVA